MAKKKTRKKTSKWTPPRGSSKYFSATSDYEFKEKHPVGYYFLVLLGTVALMLPVALYLILLVIPYNLNSPWIMLGWVGCFLIGIGFFNFVAIIIKQYLGHLVSILSFIIGAIFVWISLAQTGVV